MLLPLRIRNIMASKYDPTKAHKFIRICEDVLLKIGSLLNERTPASKELICYKFLPLHILTFLTAGNLSSDL